MQKLKLREGDVLNCIEADGSIILTPLAHSDNAKPKYTKLKIYCFNKLVILADDKVLLIKNKKAMELLAYLTCQSGAFANKTLAAEALWPDVSPENAVNSLYKTTEALKKQREHKIYIPLESLRGDFKLLKEYIYCDIWEFEHLYNNKSASNWEKAEKLYTGILLFENGYSWASEHEGRFDMMYIEILEYLYEHYKAADSVKSKYYSLKLSEF